MKKPEERARMHADANVKITRVETLPLRVPMRTPFRIANGPERPAVEVMLVRLLTDQGLVGIG